MYNLIVTVLAIVIMIAVAIAGLSYLGPAFSNAATKAVAAQILNGSAQIAGAQALYGADNGGAYDVDVAAGSATSDFVTGGYLSAVPAVPQNVAAAGATWQVVPAPGGQDTVVVLQLDDSKGGTAALCAELASVMGNHAGCVSDPANLVVAQ